MAYTHVVEYMSQLPTEGGAFYTFDTMDSSRPHYRRAWPPILYAVSLWLHETGFTSVDKDDSRPANMKVDDSDVSRFHLLIGIISSARWSWLWLAKNGKISYKIHHHLSIYNQHSYDSLHIIIVINFWLVFPYCIQMSISLHPCFKMIITALFCFLRLFYGYHSFIINYNCQL